MFDHGHFAENFPGAKLGKDAPDAGPNKAGNFHQPVFDEIDAVAGIIFMENFTTGGKMPFPGDKPQCLQLVAAQIAEQSYGFKRGHQRALYRFRRAIAHFLWRRSVAPAESRTAVAGCRDGAKANGK